MKFSIVIPVYNAERYLKSTLESVLAQTYDNWECVCVDDGSKDTSGVILDEYASHDPRFRVIHQANGGEGAARNTGLEVISGEWVVFLDSDDLLAPWTLQTYANCIERIHKTDVVRTSCVLFDEEEPLVWSSESDQNKEVRTVDIDREIDIDMTISLFCQFAYSRRVISGLKFTDHYVGADRIYQIKALLNAHTVSCVDVVTYGYRQVATSVTGEKMTFRKYAAQIKYVEDVFELMATNGHKTLTVAAVRELANVLSERAAYDIGDLPAKERSAAWELWQKSIAQLSNRGDLTPWRKFATNCCHWFGWMPCHIIARVLCIAPYMLKLRGLHR